MTSILDHSGQRWEFQSLAMVTKNKCDVLNGPNTSVASMILTRAMATDWNSNNLCSSDNHKVLPGGGLNPSEKY